MQTKTHFKVASANARISCLQSFLVRKQHSTRDGIDVILVSLSSSA